MTTPRDPDPDHGPGSDRRVTDYITGLGAGGAGLAVARDLLLAQGLAETLDRDRPCYTEGGVRIAILGLAAEGLRIGFFDGAAIDDPALIAPEGGQGPGRYLAFAGAEEVEARAPLIRRLIARARQLRSADGNPDLG